MTLQAAACSAGSRLQFAAPATANAARFATNDNQPQRHHRCTKPNRTNEEMKMNMMKKVSFAMIAVFSISTFGCATEEKSDSTPAERLLQNVREANDRVAEMKANDEIITMRVALDVMAPIQRGVIEATSWFQARLDSGATDHVIGAQNTHLVAAADELRPTFSSLGIPEPANFAAEETEACPADSPTPTPTPTPTESPTESPTEPTPTPTSSPLQLQSGYAAKAACYATALIAWRRCTLKCACYVIPALITRCAVKCGLLYATAAGLCEAIQNE
jgi:hypothetical protein